MSMCGGFQLNRSNIPHPVAEADAAAIERGFDIEEEGAGVGGCWSERERLWKRGRVGGGSGIDHAYLRGLMKKGRRT